LYSYIHGGGKIGVIVKFDKNLKIINNSDFQNCAKDIAMQVAAFKPLFLNKEEVPPKVIEYEKEILMNQTINQGKNANIAEKIVKGKIDKYFKEICLLDQNFIKDPNINVFSYIENVSKKLDTKIILKSFVRFEKGEVLEDEI
jgi:elongation factor Ts